MPRPRTRLRRRRLLPSRPLPSPRRHLRRRPPTTRRLQRRCRRCRCRSRAARAASARAPARAAPGRAPATPARAAVAADHRPASAAARPGSASAAARSTAAPLIREARRERRYGGDPAAAIQLSRRCRRRRTRGERPFAPASEVDARAVAILSPCRKTQIRVCSGRARPATVPPGPSVPQRRFEVRDRVVEVAAPPRARPLLLAQTIDHASTPLTSRQSPNNETVSRSRVSGTNMSGQ